MASKYSISVVIPAFNAQDYISDAIDSVIGQTNTPDEIIVINDGSSDNTKEIVSKVKNVRCISQPHMGVSAARNTGIRSSASAWIAFLDSDDLWIPRHIEKVMNIITKYHLEWGCGGMININYKKNLLPKAFLKHDAASVSNGILNNFFTALKKVMLNSSGIIISKKALEEVGCFDETFYVGEDIELYLRLGYKYPKVGTVEKTVIRRVRKTSPSNGEDPNIFDLIKKHRDYILCSERKDLISVLSFLTRTPMLYFIKRNDKASLRKALKDYGYLLDSLNFKILCFVASYSMFSAHILIRTLEIMRSLQLICSDIVRLHGGKELKSGTDQSLQQED